MNTPRAACGVTPLQGGCTCGPAKPVPRCLWQGAFALAVGLLLAGPASAQQVALSGVAGGKALVTIDGAAPRFLSAGKTNQGVKLRSTQGEVAVLEINGQRQSLRVGDAPVSVGKGLARTDDAGAQQRIVLTADAQGHFMPPGQINGRAVQFLVDTGASLVILSASDAQRINLNYQNGYQVKLDSVRVGEAQVYGVDAIVLPQPMAFVLLGNSFLTRFQMQRHNDQLTLQRRF